MNDTAATSVSAGQIDSGTGMPTVSARIPPASAAIGTEPIVMVREAALALPSECGFTAAAV